MTPAPTLYLLAAAREADPRGEWRLVGDEVCSEDGRTLSVVVAERAGHWTLTERRGALERTVGGSSIEDCLGAMWGW